MNSLKADREGIHWDISWAGLGLFLLQEWRVLALAAALLFHAVWIHIGQTRQDRSITALQKDDAEFKKAVAHCLMLERKK